MEVVSFLEQRKSVPLGMVTGPGPSAAELRRLLTIAARVPDHGRLEPWRFVIYRPEHAKTIGEKLAARALEIHGTLPDEELARERNRLNRAPIAIGVVSKPVEHERIPAWEQFLSAGAVAMNLVTAATAHGFAANWITGWYSDDGPARAILGLAPDERMAGIVHIGHGPEKTPERPRPDVDALISEYSGPLGKN